MVSRDNTWLGQLDTELDQLVDCRILSRDCVRTLAMYDLYIVNLMADRGMAYRGESFRDTGELSLLVVRATIGDEPQVCFINARTSFDCKRVFLRKLEEGTLSWRYDQFA